MQQYILRFYIALFFASSFALSAAAKESVQNYPSSDGSSLLARANPMNVSPIADIPMSTETSSMDEIAITVRGNQIRVQRADGLSLSVYNITGVKVATHRVDGDDFSLTLNVERGIYIVKVGKVVRRITIA